MGHWPADRFCARVQRHLGDAYHVKWHKVTTDSYCVDIHAYHTGQYFPFKMHYDDFKKINPEKVSQLAFEKFFDQMSDLIRPDNKS